MSVKSIEQVQADYTAKGEESVHLGFRQAVEAMLRDGFEGSFSNDCYSDALVLTQKMLNRTRKSLRVLSGSEGDSFFRLLERHLLEALNRIRDAGGKAQFVFIEEDGQDFTMPETLKKLETEFEGVVELYTAHSDRLLAHFMIADENMIRVEDKHGKLRPTDPETAIKAKVYFDEPQVAKGYINLFDKIVKKLTVAA